MNLMADARPGVTSHQLGNEGGGSNKYESKSMGKCNTNRRLKKHFSAQNNDLNMVSRILNSMELFNEANLWVGRWVCVFWKAKSGLRMDVKGLRRIRSCAKRTPYSDDKLLHKLMKKAKSRRRSSGLTGIQVLTENKIFFPK